MNLSPGPRSPAASTTKSTRSAEASASVASRTIAAFMPVLRLVNAGRVDERDLGARPPGHAEDALARRLGLVRDDRHLLADEGVDERGLAGVGAADHRDGAARGTRLAILDGGRLGRGRARRLDLDPIHAPPVGLLDGEAQIGLAVGLSGLGDVAEAAREEAADVENSSSSGPRPKRSRMTSMFALPDTEIRAVARRGTPARARPRARRRSRRRSPRAGLRRSRRPTRRRTRRRRSPSRGAGAGTRAAARRPSSSRARSRPPASARRSTGSRRREAPGARP